MKTTRLIIVITALCLLLSCGAYAGELPITSPEDVGMSSEKLAQVKPAVQALIDNEKIAGASVIVARKGKIVLFENFGMRIEMQRNPYSRILSFVFTP